MRKTHREQLNLDFQPPQEEVVGVEKEKRFIIETNREIKIGIGKNRKSGFAEIFVTYPDGIMRKVRLTVFNDEARREVRLWDGQKLNEETMKEIQDFVFSLFDDEKYRAGEERVINPGGKPARNRKEIRDGKMAAAGDYGHEGN